MCNLFLPKKNSLFFFCIFFYMELNFEEFLALDNNRQWKFQGQQEDEWEQD